MVRLLIFALIFALSPLCQAGGPSVSETQEFISSSLSDLWWEDSAGGSGARYSNVSVEWVGDCEMNWRAEYMGWYVHGKVVSNDKKKSANVRMNEVREISWIGLGDNPIGVFFVFENGVRSFDDSPKIIVAMVNDVNDIRSDKYKNWKIYKAFNHLRRLCGAPELVEEKEIMFD